MFILHYIKYGMSFWQVKKSVRLLQESHEFLRDGDLRNAFISSKQARISSGFSIHNFIDTNALPFLYSTGSCIAQSRALFKINQTCTIYECILTFMGIIHVVVVSHRFDVFMAYYYYYYYSLQKKLFLTSPCWNCYTFRKIKSRFRRVYCPGLELLHSLFCMSASITPIFLTLQVCHIHTSVPADWNSHCDVSYGRPKILEI